MFQVNIGLTQCILAELLECGTVQYSTVQTRFAAGIYSARNVQCCFPVELFDAMYSTFG